MIYDPDDVSGLAAGLGHPRRGVRLRVRAADAGAAVLGAGGASRSPTRSDRDRCRRVRGGVRRHGGRQLRRPPLGDARPAAWSGIASHHAPPDGGFERNDLFPLCFSVLGVRPVRRWPRSALRRRGPGGRRPASPPTASPTWSVHELVHPPPGRRAGARLRYLRWLRDSPSRPPRRRRRALRDAAAGDVPSRATAAVSSAPVSASTTCSCGAEHAADAQPVVALDGDERRVDAHAVGDHHGRRSPAGSTARTAVRTPSPPSARARPGGSRRRSARAPRVAGHRQLALRHAPREQGAGLGQRVLPAPDGEPLVQPPAALESALAQQPAVALQATRAAAGARRSRSRRGTRPGGDVDEHVGHGRRVGTRHTSRPFGDWSSAIWPAAPAHAAPDDREPRRADEQPDERRDRDRVERAPSTSRTTRPGATSSATRRRPPSSTRASGDATLTSTDGSEARARDHRSPRHDAHPPHRDQPPRRVDEAQRRAPGSSSSPRPAGARRRGTSGIDSARRRRTPSPAARPRRSDGRVRRPRRPRHGRRRGRRRRRSRRRSSAGTGRRRLVG